MHSLIRSTARLRLSTVPSSLPRPITPIASTSSTSPRPIEARCEPLAAPGVRLASNMASLKSAPGSTRNRKRLGRGQGSGYGGTSGRGHKGQLARRGNSPRLGFAGGQTPIMKLFPKLGKEQKGLPKYTPLSLATLQSWIDQGRIDATQPITMKELVDSNAVRSVKDGVKLVGDGAEHFRTPNLTIVVSDASPSAFQTIESHQGVCLSRFYTPKTLRALLKPHLFHAKSQYLPPDAHPTRRGDWEKYTDWEGRRGYLGDPGSGVSERVLREVEERRKRMGWMTRPELAERVRNIVEARAKGLEEGVLPAVEGQAEASSPAPPLQP